MPELLFEPRGAALELFYSRADEILVEGPGGTGKSRAIGELFHYCATTYPGCKLLMLRQTRVSMTDSVLRTWEQKVLWPGHPALSGPSREQRRRYTFPWARNVVDGRTYEGQSEVVLGGMENETRLYSTEYDAAWWNEAQEGTENNWESLHRALRHNHMPFQVLLGDCNPAQEHHWLNRRFPKPEGRRVSTSRVKTDHGTFTRTRLLSRHADNPFLTDTPEGQKYLAKLAALTGIRRKRLYLGEWVTAEGLIYETFDPAVNMIDRVRPRGSDRVPRTATGDIDIRFCLAGVDFGWSNPGSMSVYGFDREHRIYRLAQVYRCERDLDWWGSVAVQLWEEFDVRRFVCDSAAPEPIWRLNKALNERRGIGEKKAKRVPQLAVGVKKVRRKFMGWNLVRELLRQQPDGLPKLMFCRDALRYGADPTLVEDGQPTCTEEEIVGYTFAPYEEGKPLAKREEDDPSCPNHGLDELMYVAVYAYGRSFERPKPKGTWPKGTYGYVFEHDRLLDTDRTR